MAAITCTDRELLLQGFQQIVGKQKPRTKPQSPCRLVSTATTSQNKEFCTDRCTVYFFGPTLHCCNLQDYIHPMLPLLLEMTVRVSPAV